MLRHRCNTRGCRELVVGKYCLEHQQANDKRYAEQAKASPRTMRDRSKTREYDQTRRQEMHDGFYNSTQWRKVSAYVKERDGYRDGVDGRIWDVGELIVDHIVPRRLLDGRAAMLDESNLWLLTKSQHQHKTNVERKLGDVKLRHLDRKWWSKILKEKI